MKEIKLFETLKEIFALYGIWILALQIIVRILER